MAARPLVPERAYRADAANSAAGGAGGAVGATGATGATGAGGPCGWAAGDALLGAYHDAEWGVPVRDGRALWEMLVLEGFQAGLSWRIVLQRRDGLRAAFAGFDPRAVASFGASDVERLAADPAIIRSRAKIEAAIGNARAYLAMGAGGEDFSELAWGFVEGRPVMGDGVSIEARTPRSEAASKALRARGFRFAGPVIVQAWMQATGLINDHALDCPRRGAVGRSGG